MVELIRGLRAEVVKGNLERVRSEIAAAGRDPTGVQILAAVKYVPVDELGVLADAGIELVGENRAQDLVAKAEAYPGPFTWDFIGQLQSRKVRQVCRTCATSRPWRANRRSSSSGATEPPPRRS